MKTVLRSMALAGLCLLSAGSASAGVTVTFSHPENYVDMPFSPTDREQVLKDLTEHFGKLAASLPPGQDLKIEILDLDLAGRLRPNFRGSGQDIRIMRGGADWPHLHLRYTLESGGQVLASGEEHLSNMNYLDRINRYASGDTLRYEKQMIDDWFKQKIVPKHFS